jgi:chromate transporter
MMSLHVPGRPVTATDAIPFREAVAFWLRLGFISFGGPAGQIAMMHQELVERRRWISERRFLHALNYCMVLPGPEAQQLATYIGWLMHRTWGGIVAGSLFVLPSLLILIGLSWLYVSFGTTPVVAGLFYGIKPAVTAIVLHAAQRIGSRTLRHPWLWAIAAASFVASAAGRVPFPAVIALAAVAGLVAGRLAPAAFAGPAVIDDNTPTPGHARFRWRRLLAVVAGGASLWLLPMGLLTRIFGLGHPLTQMGLFFSKAALLTFGGAYAVLPYVVDGAVQQHGWLTTTQMIDGLALGETTPGPLIMVLAFVGFVGGYGRAFFGPDAAALAGILAAVVVTWFTFLPSFVFILAGGPLVESTHGEVSFTAPLTAITAAVVGVILNLALFFAGHVFWPDGIGAGFDAVAALISVGALVALVRWRCGVVPLLAVCGLLGLLRMATA